jgi:hypothetical protein
MPAGAPVTSDREPPPLRVIIRFTQIELRRAMPVVWPMVREIASVPEITPNLSLGADPMIAELLGDCTPI